MMTWSEMMETEFGYKTKTTFWDDFSIAEAYGEKAIIDTYDRAFKEWKSDVEYLTELVLVLNHKIWAYYQTNVQLGELYNTLWDKTHTWCLDHLKGDDLTYYWQTKD